MPLPRLVATIVLLVVITACDNGSESMTVDQARREAEVILQAKLVAGSTGRDAFQLVRELIDVPGVAATRGDAGEHVWVYSAPAITSAQLRELRQRLLSDQRVQHLTRCGAPIGEPAHRCTAPPDEVNEPT